MAKRFELEVKTTGDFAAGERVAEFGNQPRAAAAAFKLTQEHPFSDTLQTEQGYLIMNLVGVQPSKPLSLDEAKGQLSESLKADKVRETLALKAADVRKNVEEALKAGKTFVQAAEGAGVKAETLEPFSRSESKLTGDDASLIQNGAADLKAGQTSAAIEGPAGTLLVHVLKRQEMDPADLEKQKPSLVPMLETQRVDGLLSEWIERQRAASGLQIRQEQ